MIKSKWFFNKWYILAGYEVVLDDERSGNIAGKEVCAFNLKPVELNVSDVELFGYKADKVGHNVVAKGKLADFHNRCKRGYKILICTYFLFDKFE